MASINTPNQYPKEYLVDHVVSSTYLVEGMTCEHCAASVSDAITGLDGVVDVTIDRSSGRLDVKGREVGDGQVQAAVAKAGYQVVGGS